MKRGTSNYGNRLVIVLVLACILLFSGLGYMILRGGDEGNIIGVIHIEGAITSSRKIGEISAAINNAITDPQIKGVVVKMDSPGGYAHLVEQVYLDLLELKQRKPVVASLVAALSGGYYIASAADRVFANPGTLTGSIGVVMRHSNVDALYRKIGLSTSVIKSGEYKDIGSSFRNITPREERLFQGLLDTVHGQFIDAVAAGRGMERENRCFD